MTVKSIGGLPRSIWEQRAGVEAFVGPKRAERTRVGCERTVGDAIAALGHYVEYTVSRLLNGD